MRFGEEAAGACSCYTSTKASRDWLEGADTVLAKHDESYMPPEVAAALRESGMWHEETGDHSGYGGASGYGDVETEQPS